MKRSMTVAYEVDGALYVNITNRCTNSCSFCIRNNGDGAYGSDSLWLLREPTVDEIVDAVTSHDLTRYREIVFCGYGEPSMRLREAREAALRIKKASHLPIRINTNGHSDLILGENSAPLYAQAFDTVSISLNTPNPDRYVEICHPVYGKDAFFALLSFAQNVKNYVQNVILSVVGDTLTESEIEQCREIAEKVGVTLRVRDYIGKP